MALTVHDDHGVAIVEVAGELDEVHSPALGQVCEQLLTAGHRQIIIDLRGVEFIDSAGLSMLIRYFQRTRKSAGTFLLAAPRPPVRSVFELMRLDRTFEIYSDTVEAVRDCLSKQGGKPC
jgi:anti-sigma B factor antagonist